MWEELLIAIKNKDQLQAISFINQIAESEINLDVILKRPSPTENSLLSNILHQIRYNNYHQLLKLLFDRIPGIIDPSFPLNNSNGPFHSAIASEQIEMLSLLFEYRSITDSSSRGLLFYALICGRQNTNILKVIVENNPNSINLKDYGSTILHTAAQLQAYSVSLTTSLEDISAIEEAILKFVLEKIDPQLINAQDRFGETALHMANLRIDRLKILLPKMSIEGINTKNNQGHTALSKLATMHWHTATAQIMLLLEYTTDIEVPSKINKDISEIITMAQMIDKTYEGNNWNKYFEELQWDKILFRAFIARVKFHLTRDDADYNTVFQKALEIVNDKYMDKLLTNEEISEIVTTAQMIDKTYEGTDCSKYFEELQWNDTIFQVFRVRVKFHLTKDDTTNYDAIFQKALEIVNNEYADQLLKFIQETIRQKDDFKIFDAYLLNVIEQVEPVPQELLKQYKALTHKDDLTLNTLNYAHPEDQEAGNYLPRILSTNPKKVLDHLKTIEKSESDIADAENFRYYSDYISYLKYFVTDQDIKEEFIELERQAHQKQDNYKTNSLINTDNLVPETAISSLESPIEIQNTEFYVNEANQVFPENINVKVLGLSLEN